METKIKSNPITIYNYLLLDENIATGGQPDESELRQLANQGFAVIVNLGLTDTEYALADEAKLISELGMAYYHIPVIWEVPVLEDFKKFVVCMKTTTGKRRFIHCAANKRVSVFMALYNILYCGKNNNAVIKNIERIWQPNAVWQKFINDVLNYGG